MTDLNERILCACILRNAERFAHAVEQVAVTELYADVYTRLGADVGGEGESVYVRYRHNCQSVDLAEVWKFKIKLVALEGDARVVLDPSRKKCAYCERELSRKALAWITSPDFPDYIAFVHIECDRLAEVAGRKRVSGRMLEPLTPHFAALQADAEKRPPVIGRAPDDKVH